MGRLRVFIVDDQEIVRGGLRRLLEMQPDFSVVGEAASGDEAVQLVPDADPDLILMDIKMPGMDGIEATRAVRTLAPRARVVVLTVYANDFVTAALEAGAHAFLLKDVSGQELVRALRGAAAGAATIHVSMPADELPEWFAGGDPPPEAALSPRQKKVLELLALGATNAEIAGRLFVSRRTVKRELTDIFQKLGLRGRGQAMAWAHAHRRH